MVKMGFVGCGGIMQEHYKHLCAIPNVKMVGHCDADAARAQAAADRYGGDAFTDFVQLFDKAKPQAVYIAVPPSSHGPIEEAAAARGIHMFIEKPVALNRATGKRIAAAVQKARVLTSVGYCFRYHDTVNLAKAFLKGKVVSLVTGCWTGSMPELWWWRQRKHSGGQVIEQTTHLFDLVRYLCGEVAEVHAVASHGCMTNVPEYDIDDSSVAILRLKNGASACLASTCVAGNGGKVSLEIVTPEATLHLQDGALTISEKDKRTEYRPSSNVYEEEARAFFDAVRNGKRNRIRSPYADALRTLQVTCAAAESIATGLPVKP